MDERNLNSDGFIGTSFGSQARTDALAPPEPRNEGGISTDQYDATSQSSDAPRLVTRGESYQVYETTCDDGESFIVVYCGKKSKVIRIPQPQIDGVASSATIDWLNCSFRLKSNFSLDYFFGCLLPILGKQFSPAKSRERGCYGYKNSFGLGDSKALFAYGGNHETGFLSFSGDSCHQIPNWHALVNFLRDELKANITRADLAHDDFLGVHSVDNALRMYQEGLFTSGGREPRMDQRGNWIKPDGRGRTLYIGSSENGKLLRVYEKGMQLGAPYHPWVRWELQLGNKDRDIPWDVVIEPGKFLAGSYPNAMSWIAEEQSRIRTLKNTSLIGYDSLVHSASVAYGKLFNVMLQKEGSYEKAFEKLVREGFPARLNLPEIPNYGKVMP